MSEAQAQLDTFLAKYTPDVEALARDLLGRLRKRISGACILVYDNYNALAIGFGPDEQASHATVSIALYPRWINLFFLQGASLDDPDRLLKGNGKQVRHIRIGDPAILDAPPVAAMLGQAIARSQPPFDAGREQQLVIKSISARQRPRRP